MFVHHNLPSVSAQTFSIGFVFGDCDGRVITEILFCFLQVQRRCWRSLSSRNIHSMLFCLKNLLAEGNKPPSSVER